MRAALYCRLSEEDKDKGTSEESMSIQNQKSMLTQYALDKGWEIVEIYSDEDYSGADRSRPEFCRMIDDCKNGKIDVVLCKTQSRFSREIEVIEKYLHTLFPIWNVRFVSIVDCADTQRRENKKARQINGLINEWYLEDLSENIKSVLTSRRKAGLHIGSFALYGYVKDNNNKGHIIPDPAAASVVQRIFSLYCNGYGKSAIARILNAEGVPSPSEYKRLCGIKYKTSTKPLFWRYSTIDTILKNQMYIGNMVQGRYKSISYKSRKVKTVPKSDWIISENTHKPIIDLHIWNKTQALLSQKTKPYTKGQKGAFSGLIKCLYCGCSMRKSNSRGKVYYRCSSHYISKEACVGSFISEEVLLNAVIERLKSLCDIYFSLKLIEQKKAASINISNKNYDVSVLEKQKQNILLSIKALYTDYASEKISNDEFHFLLSSYKKDKSMIESQISQCNDKSTSYSFCDNYKDRFDEIMCNKNNRFMIFHLFIHKISVGRHKKGEGSVPVEIHWTF